MNEELIFRIVFWTFLFFIYVFTRVIPALRAKKSGQKIFYDKKAIRDEGIAFYLRVILSVLFLPFLVLYSMYPPFMNLIHLDFPVWLRWLGTLFGFIGTAFWIYSQAVLDKYWSPQLQVQKEHKMITTGPYKVIRHPIYAATFIWVIGLALYTANMVFAFIALLAIIWLILRVPKEEKMMIGQFGDEYEQYILNTGKFFPKLRRRSYD